MNQTKEQEREILDYIEQSENYWTDLRPKLNEMMVSYREFYELIKGLVDDGLIEPSETTDWKSLRITIQDELAFESPLLFRIKSRTINIPTNEYQPKQKDIGSKLWNIACKYWWTLIIPLVGLIIYDYIKERLGF